MSGSDPSFLVIRRDNIGDLVCTTPLFRALRERFPSARICALVNSYNRPVLQGNPDIDEVFSYTKAKHRPAGQGVLKVYFERMKLILRLRRTGFDYAILAAPGFQSSALRFARLIKPRQIVGVASSGRNAGLHEVEDSFRVLKTLGIEGNPPGARVYPDSSEAALSCARLSQLGAEGKETPVVGIHISARKPSQRWPMEFFAALIALLHRKYGARFMLFWSPGDENNPLHPGDDGKAAELMSALGEVPVLAYPTRRLEALIAGLSTCDVVVCSDGGAMHLAAGLGKPILCFFGQSDAVRWHPWGVPYVLLQPESLEVKDISVAEALAGFSELMEKIG